MAKKSCAASVIPSLFTLSVTIISISIPSVRSQLSVSPILLSACSGLPKSSKFTVYSQSDESGVNDVEDFYYVIQSPITPTPPSNFGQIIVADDKLTVGPDYNSQEVGRSQGTFTLADLNVLAAAYNINYYFTDGIYNGSMISVLGRNPVFAQPQNHELSVVGGTGIFRCATGYVIANTYLNDPVTENNIYQYNFYVDYYSI